VKEDIAVSVKDNFVRYHLTDDDSEITVIDDFNRVSTSFSAVYRVDQKSEGTNSWPQFCQIKKKYLKKIFHWKIPG